MHYTKYKCTMQNANAKCKIQNTKYKIQNACGAFRALLLVGGAACSSARRALARAQVRGGAASGGWRCSHYKKSTRRKCFAADAKEKSAVRLG